MLDLKDISITFNAHTVNERKALSHLNPVSYTHLDVYKRQLQLQIDILTSEVKAIHERSFNFGIFMSHNDIDLLFKRTILNR